jgi:hypothetical protein
MLEAFTSAFDPSGHNRSSGLVVSRATIPHRVSEGIHEAE